MSKRPAGVLLGTSWGVKAQRMEECRCAAFEPRKPLSKEKLAEKISSGNRAMASTIAKCAAVELASQEMATSPSASGRAV